jgi:hypothetical protein
MKLLREPMLHFVIAGALLFAGDAFLNRDQAASDEVESIRIGEGEIRWLHETFANQWQRPPTNEELSGLVASLLEEELLAREARALGLDQGDTIVRRRLAQKLSFLVEDTSQIVEPTEDELHRFYSANIDRFQTEPRVSFAQIFFSTERRRHAEADAKAALISISATDGTTDPALMGDSLLLEQSFRDIDRRALSGMFGADFAAAVFGLKPGSWHGPIRSGFGLHLVEVTHVSPAVRRPFEAVRSKVMEDWRRQRESEMNASYLAKLREKYGVVVEDGIKPLLTPEATGSAMQ